MATIQNRRFAQQLVLIDSLIAGIVPMSKGGRAAGLTGLLSI
jgi:hypothetical protein